MISVNDKVEETIRKFVCEFIEHPYLCYTEHGQHARFYQMLYEALDPSQRYLTWMGQKVCVIQKEYPTATDLGKSKRQHWDIAIIKSPPESIPNKEHSYDYLKLEAIVEFGMNEAKGHIDDDIERLSYVDDNGETTAAHKYIVHLYRLSKAGKQFSMRDRSPSAKRKIEVELMTELIRERKSLTIFYGVYNDTDKSKNGLWRIKEGAELEKLACR